MQDRNEVFAEIKRLLKSGDVLIAEMNQEELNQAVDYREKIRRMLYWVIRNG